MNPVAGACGQRDGIGRLVAQLRACGHEVEWQKTNHAGHARELAAQATQTAQAVVAVGGDGTVCEVAHGLSGTGVPLAIWPTGTENLVARSLGFRAEPGAMLGCLSGGHRIQMDVGVANGRTFLVVAGVGFDAEVVHRLTRVRNGHITHFSYTGPIWRAFWEHRFPPICVRADGEPYWTGRGMVFVGNLARYALGLPVVRDAIPNDGLLDLCIYECDNRFELIGHSLRTVFGRHIEHPRVRYKRIRKVRVESACEVPVQIDGDAAGHLPLDIEVRPAAVAVLIPPALPTGYNLPTWLPQKQRSA
jgi:diacylglycerol kinase (ATP)